MSSQYFWPVRVKKFLAAYEKTPAPAAGYGDHALKGYEASKGGIIFIRWEEETFIFVRLLKSHFFLLRLSIPKLLLATAENSPMDMSERR